MPVDDKRLRVARRAVTAALASVLLASCSTSNQSDEFFGFSASAHSAAGIAAQRAAPVPAADVNATAQGPVASFVMDDNDPKLPDNVADAPSLRPVSAEEAASIAQQQAVAPAQQLAAAETGHQAASQPPPASPTPSPASEVLATTEPSQPVSAFVAPAEPQKKRGFLASLFGNQQESRPEPRALVASVAPAQTQPTPAAKPLIQVAAATPARPLAGGAAGQAALPGVRSSNSLYEISRGTSAGEDDDIDVYEGEDNVQVASAAGLARLAPNGLLKQTDNVEVNCLKPSLVRMLRSIESHFGRKAMITSGYRSPDRNRRARGARNSLHMYCAAADVKIEGVTKAQLANYVRSMPGRGGVGTYCHTDAVHIDVGPERDWNWRCRRRK